jgi:hypothetical protein
MWQARDDGDHTRALEDARAAAAIRKSSSLMFFTAEELVSLKRRGEAFAAVEECLELAQSEPPSENHDKVLVGCRALRQELRPAVALVKLIAPQPAPADLRVMLQGGPPRAVPNERFPVEPGRLRVEARAEGFAPFEWTGDVRAGSDVDVPLTLAPARSETVQRSNIAPFVVLGSGVAALLAAGAIRLVANGRYDELVTQCREGLCPADKLDRRSSIETLDAVAMWTAIAGGALTIGGAVWWLTGRPGAPDRKGTAIKVGPAYVGVVGRF